MRNTMRVTASIPFGARILRLICLFLMAFFSSIHDASAAGWIYNSEENPLTGGRDSWTSIQASGPTSGDTISDSPMLLYVSCLEGKLEVSLETGNYMGRGWLDVRYRFDEDGPISEKWISSNDGTALFVPSKYKDFRRGMRVANKLAIEVYDYRGVPFRTVFDSLLENSQFIDRVIEECK